MNLLQKDKHHIWHPFTQQKLAPDPLLIERAEGSYIYTKDGRKIFDAISSWWVNIHGHCHPHIVDKVHQQFKKLDQVIFAGASHEGAIQLAERVINLLPDGFSRIFYSDNGSTAVEVALKMALQYWYNLGSPKKKIVAFRHGYHGDTFGGMSASERSTFTEAFAPLLFDVCFIDPPLRAHKQGRTCAQMQQLCENYDDIAAFIYEPLVQGAGGMLMQNHEELEGAIKIAKEHKIICIADEAMTGFGRTGKLFASDHLAQKPDIICLAKGLTGGSLPLSITSCREWIYEAFHTDEKTKAFFHGHSYTANALGCAAANASLDLMLEESTTRAIKEIGQHHSEFVDFLRDSKLKDCFNDIRQQGTILALEFQSGNVSGYFNDLRDALANFFIAEGAFLRPLGNVVYCIPPYCANGEDLRKAYDPIVAFAEKYVICS